MIEQYNERIEDRLENFNFNFCQELENHSESDIFNFILINYSISID